jgi:hypothetical protein
MCGHRHVDAPVRVAAEHGVLVVFERSSDVFEPKQARAIRELVDVPNG